jgi:hypothetical protein
MPAMSLPRSLATAALGAALATSTALQARAQSQALSFTGGVLLNPKIGFGNLGALGPASGVGPATGGTFNRTYANGFNRVDEEGNKEGRTGFWGYEVNTQISGDTLVLSSPGGATAVAISDAGDLAFPSGNLEYRGSMGSLGRAHWGLLLSVGYQNIGAEASGSWITDASVIEDRFSLGGLTPSDLPPAPYAGTSSTKTPRIGSNPDRSFRTLPGARQLSGNWEFDADLIPISGGLYTEAQLFGRLNAIAGAGVFVAFVNAEFRINERSTLAGEPTVTTRLADGTNDVIYGGFVQLGLDWALWEEASLVASARWQPCADFDHSVAGREVNVDFLSAIAIHIGFAMRF